MPSGKVICCSFLLEMRQISKLLEDGSKWHLMIAWLKKYIPGVDDDDDDEV